MSELLKNIILGIIQGVAEFLPVSSSGHIELAEYFLSIENDVRNNLTISVILHLATALSTIVVFRKDILQIIGGLFDKSENYSRKFSFWIVLSMIPAGLVGYLFEDRLDGIYNENIPLVALSLIVTGFLLFLADRNWRNDKDLDTGKSVLVGMAQALALTPGISRSGATIGVALLLGVERSKAARFSFLMVLPLIFGKVAKDLISGDFVISELGVNTLFAFIVAFLVGVFACRLMINLVQNSRLRYFAYYCFITATLSLVLYYK